MVSVPGIRKKIKLTIRIKLEYFKKLVRLLKIDRQWHGKYLCYISRDDSFYGLHWFNNFGLKIIFAIFQIFLIM